MGEPLKTLQNGFGECEEEGVGSESGVGGVPGGQGAPEHGGQAWPYRSGRWLERGSWKAPAQSPQFLDGKSERAHFQAFCLTCG